MADDVIKNAESKIARVIDSLKSEYMKLRSGRVSVSLLDDIKIECYGSVIPVNQAATISNPEARLLVISPWDSTLLSAIEKAIQKENLGVNPSNDGKVIRLAFPPLSEERRQGNVKFAKICAENHKVSVRNIRRDFMDELKKKEKASEISETERKQLEDKLQKLVDKSVDDISAIFDSKSKEIMEI